MKSLKFREKLSKKILEGRKDTTWRLFDDKNLSVGEVISLIVSETNKEFGKAKIISIKETTFENLTEEDKKGHEKFSSDEEMYETYSKYYKKDVNKNTELKVIKLEVIIDSNI